MGKVDKIQFKNTYKLLRDLWTKEYLFSEYEKHAKEERILLYNARCQKEAGDLLSLLKDQIRQNLPPGDYYIHVQECGKIMVRWGLEEKKYLKRCETQHSLERWSYEEKVDQNNQSARECGLILFLLPFIIVFVWSILKSIQ